MIRSVLLCLAILTGAINNTSGHEPVDASTLHGKVLAGYQAWFRHPGDGSPDNKWVHWCRSQDIYRITVEFWPEMSEYPDAYDCGLILNNGQPALVYSNYHYSAVDLHFRWMQEYNIDGALLQRFVSGIRSNPSKGRQVIANVRQAAEAYGRVFAMEYDISNANPTGILDALVRDWETLVLAKKLTESSSYLHHNGRPVLAVWGFGFNDDKRHYTPAEALELIARLRFHVNLKCRPYIIGGVPSGWRTLSRDSRREAAWTEVYESFDGISPWTVGRYRGESAVDKHRRDFWEPDIQSLDAKGIDYMPVIFPGTSTANLKEDGKSNSFPRNGGRFLWRQAWNLIDAGATMIKIAMFDEVDEGTAIYKVAPTQAGVPATSQFPNDQPEPGIFVSLDSDGYDLPSDFYLQLADAINQSLDGDRPLGPEMPIESTPRLSVKATPAEPNGLTPVRVGDGRYQVIHRQGHLAWHIDGTDSQRYLYFRVADGLADGLTGDLHLDITYYDASVGTMRVQYDGNSAAYQTSVPKSITTRGTGTWKIATFTLEDIRFDHRQNNGADFRILLRNRSNAFSPITVANLTIRSAS